LHDRYYGQGDAIISFHVFDNVLAFEQVVLTINSNDGSNSFQDKCVVHVLKPKSFVVDVEDEFWNGVFKNLTS
jgi:hypothetical protein